MAGNQNNIKKLEKSIDDFVENFKQQMALDAKERKSKKLKLKPKK